MKTLDLHGVKHEDVKLEVIKFVEKELKVNDMCEITFGHSPNMWKLVKEVLDEYDALLSYSLGGVLKMSKTFVSIWWK